MWMVVVVVVLEGRHGGYEDAQGVTMPVLVPWSKL